MSISDSSGALGTFRNLLFDIAPTETDDPWGNTFFSEIDVVPGGGRRPLAKRAIGHELTRMKKQICR